MSTHRIHLRGPWDYSFRGLPGHQVESAATQGTVAMPRAWREIFGETGGTALFRRKFHRPTNLSPQERVVVVCTEVRGFGRATLNDDLLGNFASEGQAVEFEITELINPFNEFAIELTFDPAKYKGLPGGLFGVVALEIRSVDQASG